MENSIINSFIGVINSCFSWFSNFFSSLPVIYNLLLCAIILITIYRFLLSPLFGGGSFGKSDNVKNNKNNQKQKKGYNK